MATAGSNRNYAIAIGIGVALFPLHCKWLVDVTSINGQATLFFPVFGAAIWIMAALFFIRDHWKDIDWGDKRIFIPLIIIALSIGVSGVVNGTGIGKVTPFLMGLSLFALYGVVRYLALSGVQEYIKKPIIITVFLVALGGIIAGIVVPGKQDGGLITNYCAAAGFLILGGLLISRKWLWLAITPLLISIFLIGALEGVFIVAMMAAVVVLVRRDWGKKILLPVGVLVILVGGWSLLGNTENTYRNAVKNIDAVVSIQNGEADGYGGLEEALDAAITWRWSVIKDAIENTKWLGHGYILTPAPSIEERHVVHNMPLLAVDQVGPVAGAAWLWVTLFCLVKTRWKYMWIAVLVASIFDHYIWTQLAPYWWMFIGLSTIDTTPDLIFKKI